jgi:hypothetical protein
MAFFHRSRKGGRRREDDGVSAVGFELTTLEFVQASDELGLLRIGGRWMAPCNRVLDRVVLTVRRDSETIEIDPLPDMNAASPLASPAGEEWRAAFTMSVEVAEDPRSELALVSGDEARIALPRPGEAIEEEPEAVSPVVAELMEKLQEVALLEDEDRALELDAMPPPEPEPVQEDPQVAALQGEVEMLRIRLEQVTRELALERERRRTVEADLRGRAAVESDLRNAIATQEAELASALAQATQRERQAERRRDVIVPAENGDRPEPGRSNGADEDFLARLERARRASETAVG